MLDIVYAARIQKGYFHVFFPSAPGYVTVDTPVPFGSTVTSTPLLSHSHTSPLTFMTPTVNDYIVINCVCASDPLLCLYTQSSLHSSRHSTPHNGSFLGSCTPTPTRWVLIGKCIACLSSYH